MESFKSFISEDKKEYEVNGKKGTRREWKKQVTLFSSLFSRAERAKTRKALLKVMHDGDAGDIFGRQDINDVSDYDLRKMLSNYFESIYVDLINSNAEILKKNNELGKF